MDNITFDAVVSKVATMTDGGIRVTLDLPETAIQSAAWLMECKRVEMPLRVACAAAGEGSDGGTS